MAHAVAGRTAMIAEIARSPYPDTPFGQLPFSMTHASKPERRAQIPPEAAGRRLDQVVAELFPEFSRSRLSAWIKSGDVLLDGATAVPRQIVRGDETVVLQAEPTQEVPLAPES